MLPIAGKAKPNGLKIFFLWTLMGKKIDYFFPIFKKKFPAIVCLCMYTYHYLYISLSLSIYDYINVTSHRRIYQYNEEDFRF